MPDFIETNEIKFTSDVLQSTIPVLAFFKSEWCPVCKRITPWLEKLSDQYQDRVKFVRINVVDNRNLAARHNVLAIPTLIIFKNSQEAVRNIGFLDEDNLKNFIDKNL